MSYKSEQLKRRLVMMFFGSLFFSLPGLFKLRIKAYRNAFEIGKNPIIENNVWLTRTHKLPGKITIGNNVLLARDIIIDYSGNVDIADNVWFSEGAVILSHDHVLGKNRISRRDGSIVTTQTEIKEGAWIGARAIVLPKVKSIGSNSVIGAGAVVVSDVPDNVVIAGNPAKIVKQLEL